VKQRRSSRPGVSLRCCKAKCISDLGQVSGKSGGCCNGYIATSPMLPKACPPRSAGERQGGRSGQEKRGTADACRIFPLRSFGGRRVVSDPEMGRSAMSYRPNRPPVAGFGTACGKLFARFLLVFPGRYFIEPNGSVRVLMGLGKYCLQQPPRVPVPSRLAALWTWR